MAINDPLDVTFHALSDGTRRAMLAMLTQRGECSAGELGAQFDSAQPTISKHIKVLERAGLVTRSVQGREHRFRLVAAQLQQAEQWIARHRAFWQHSLDALGELLDQPDADDTPE